MVIATLFRPNSPAKTPWSRIAWILVFAAGFAAAGYLLRPLLQMGIHKNSATPAWVLDCLAIACVIYAFLYWLVDVQKVDRWTVLVAPAGSNTLLMYLLPFMLYSALTVLKVDYLQTRFNEGWVGVARSAVIAVCLVAVTGLLTRCRIRLQL
jgi:heparan-alpha-glucosaminide N-acetyltransferase